MFVFLAYGGWSDPAADLMPQVFGRPGQTLIVAVVAVTSMNATRAVARGARHGRSRDRGDRVRRARARGLRRVASSAYVLYSSLAYVRIGALVELGVLLVGVLVFLALRVLAQYRYE